MASGVTLFFALFSVPASILAVLALREFLHRHGPRGPERVDRAVVLLLLSAACSGLLVVLATALTGGAPLVSAGGWVFLGWGAVQVALGIAGARLFRRAAEAPLRRTVKAAETLPMVAVLLHLVLVYNAWVQVP